MIGKYLLNKKRRQRIQFSYHEECTLNVFISTAYIETISCICFLSPWPLKIQTA